MTRFVACVGLLGGVFGSPTLLAEGPPSPPIIGDLLNMFLFDTTNFVDFSGSPPLTASNLALVSSWQSNAVQIASGQPAVLRYPELQTNGWPSLACEEGSLLFWFKPAWGGTNNGVAAPFLEVGTWTEDASIGWWSLFYAENRIQLAAQTNGAGGLYLDVPVAFVSNEWVQIVVNYTATNSSLWLNEQCLTNGIGVTYWPGPAVRANGFCVGSDGSGVAQIQGQMELLLTFNGPPLHDWQITDFYETFALMIEEWEAPDDFGDGLGGLDAPQPSTRPPERDGLLDAMGECASELLVRFDGGGVILTLTNATPGEGYDLYRTFDLLGNYATNSFWQRVAQGTNGQSFIFTNCCPHVFYLVACDTDTDADGLTDAYEVLVSKTSPATNRTLAAFGNPFTDLQGLNVLVNDPEQDCATEQNTQDETTLLAFSNTVICAWVDSNRGVPGYGFHDATCVPPTTDAWFPSSTPEWIGWGVSRDGGATFEDKGGLPLWSNVCIYVNTNLTAQGQYEGHYVQTHVGNAGDPVLGRDVNSGIIYLTGNPQRPSVYYPSGPNTQGYLWIPVWRSLDNGTSFNEPVNASAGLAAAASEFADKPAMIVDNHPLPGAGQGDVYLAFKWANHPNSPNVVCRSEAGGTNWQVMQSNLGVGTIGASLAIITNSGPRELCLVWVNAGTNISFSKSLDRGTNFSTPTTVVSLTNSPLSLYLLRSRTTDGNDNFRAPIIPTLVPNPVNGDLYVVYQDYPTGTTEHPSIYFTQSTNGGVNWNPPWRVNSDANYMTNDHWQPVLTAKPDGTQLFIAWYDRRNDPTNNSLLEVYGVFASLPLTGAGSFTNNFPISTVQFPPVFSGTNAVLGAYDPAYPPFIDPAIGCFPGWFRGTYSHHMADYDTAVSDNNTVLYSWSDKRALSTSNDTIRNQAEIRLIRLPWPDL